MSVKIRGLQAAVKRVNGYIELVPRRVDAILKRACEIGVDVIKREYSDSLDQVSMEQVVYTKTSEGHYSISCSGESFYYLEFGAGIVANPGGRDYLGYTPEDFGVTGISPIGQYGEGHGGTGQPWVFQAKDGTFKMTYGTRARAAFPKAADAMQQYLESKKGDLWWGTGA